MSNEILFILQPYRAKPHRLVPLPAQIFDDEAEARATAKRMARFRTGIVVLRQNVDAATARKGVPAVLAVFGQVPAQWSPARSAA